MVGDLEHATFSFQPTLPARGATVSAYNDLRGDKFQPTLPARGATATSAK